MCSIVMPGEYDMLVAHSPPIFSHSPPASGFLSRCDSFPRMSRFCKPVISRSVPKAVTPTRPILIIRPASGEEDLDDGPGCPMRLKKKVVFADDRGMSLCHVRIMTEPSNVPPVWSIRFLAHMTQDPGPLTIEEPWEIAFTQPASDYVAFRKRLDADKVSLENVIVKTAEEVVVGTVKVCNLAFEKNVFLRITTDGWRSHKDVACTYLSGNVAGSAYVLYDTFSFRVPLPAEALRLEFCVLFRCNQRDHWDNNHGENYVLRKNRTRPVSAPQIITEVGKSSDIFNAKMDSWSEFACWNQLENNTPYW